MREVHISPLCIISSQNIPGRVASNFCPGDYHNLFEKFICYRFHLKTSTYYCSFGHNRFIIVTMGLSLLTIVDNISLLASKEANEIFFFDDEA